MPNSISENQFAASSQGCAPRWLRSYSSVTLNVSTSRLKN